MKGQNLILRKTVLRDEQAASTQLDFYRDVISGLMQPVKQIPSKYFYDDVGSMIYSEITELNQYYLTAAERENFASHGSDIINRFFNFHHGTTNVVELGAGNDRKTYTILEKLIDADQNIEYIPVDISASVMNSLFNSLQGVSQKKALRVHGVVADYKEGIEYIAQLYPGRCNVVLFLGSSIGNFPPADAIDFLKMIGASLRDGDILLLGSDLKKNPTLLQTAYDDSAGVTRKFNLNLLARLNRELGTDFKVEKFMHQALYDPTEGCMKSFLLSTEAQTVRIPSCESSKADIHVKIQAWEPILTEYSYKYNIDQVHTMLRQAGYEAKADYIDSQGFFLNTVSRKAT